ncbi:hypothetical protein BDA99DRAFT_556525 [Phascolomyces articulosus]|uniref:HMG box domain-containing protein n=1 Tax=Phascolomyces articulosus TaxID=60185 RepID=A0AAD5K7M5_9FUNG|nr:hypothetical protein BDA99DRAFT_556525 [Phascolomyces articulosus]
MNSSIDESTDDSQGTITTTAVISPLLPSTSIATDSSLVSVATIPPTPVINNNTTTTTVASSLSLSPSGSQQQRSIKSDHHQVKTFLANCNLSQYYNVMIQEGFDQLEALFEVTEHDLEQMGVKRGHRRLLQRAIANNKGKPSYSSSLYLNHQNLDYFGSSDQPEGDLMNRDKFVLLTPPSSHTSCSTTAATTIASTSSASAIVSHRASVSSMSGGTQTSSSNDEETSSTVTSENINKIWKRKYRRRARADDNAPKKPPSAYVMFSNDVRAELKEQNLSFTALSKITGDRWKNLDPNQRKIYEMRATFAKEDYILALEKYELTDEHKQYQQYLNEFRTRHESSVDKPRKRSRSFERKEIDQGSTSPCESMISDPSTNELPSGSSTTSNHPTLQQQHPNHHLLREPPPPQQQETRYPYWLLNDTTSTPSNHEPTSISDLPTIDVLYPDQTQPQPTSENNK